MPEIEPDVTKALNEMSRDHDDWPRPDDLTPLDPDAEPLHDSECGHAAEVVRLTARVAAVEAERDRLIKTAMDFAAQQAKARPAPEKSDGGYDQPWDPSLDPAGYTRGE